MLTYGNGRRHTTVALLCAVLFGLAVPAAGAAEPAPPGPSAGQEARQAARFWTAQRMADARPLDAARQAPKPAPGRPAAARRPQATAFKGTRLVGTFFGADGPRGTTWHCTGSVIDTRARNIVLTAAHCALNMKGDYIFVPPVREGRGPRPAAVRHLPHPADLHRSPVRARPRLDHHQEGRVRPGHRVRAGLGQPAGEVPPGRGGRRADLHPARRLHPAERHRRRLPSHRHNSAGRAVKCTVPTTRLRGYRQLSMTCGGYYGGVSGSPWITDYKDDARGGHVIGNLGGYNGGGNDANVDYISYATAFGADAANLLAHAVADRTPPADLPPYRGLKGHPCPAAPGAGGRPRSWPVVTTPATGTAICSWSGPTAASPCTRATARAASGPSSGCGRPTPPGPTPAP
ncbi:hypothetical protein LT493_32200 [Streptomyces tricolor]|nr:hypothetical protein [Streptomyces tricolor]